MAVDVRVRIAPSPTGKLHLGTARTALFNYLFAKRHGGQFILRIEDSDRERSKPEFTEDILISLKWLGLEFDEGPGIGGSTGPYLQSERLQIYQGFINQLLETKQAYRCFCQMELLTADRLAQQAKGRPPKYLGHCRNLTKEQIRDNLAAKKLFTVRLAVEPQTIKFDDLIRGTIEVNSDDFGDFVIVRSDGWPIFLFANAIDDHLMKISHCLRGEDHLSNTGRQLLITKALAIGSAQFGHIPLILNADRTKMSKRRDPVSVTDDFKNYGYLPSAMVNFLALLGWSSGDDREIFSLEALINEFQLERVGKSPAIFDPQKLLWMNGYYIRQSKLGELAEAAGPFITDSALKVAVAKEPDMYIQAVALVQERLKTLAEIEPLIKFILIRPAVYDRNLLVAKGSTLERAKLALAVATKTAPTIKKFCQDDCELALRQAAKKAGLKDGELLWTVRVALSGQAASPGCFELLDVFGPNESLKRLEAASKKLLD